MTMTPILILILIVAVVVDKILLFLLGGYVMVNVNDNTFTEAEFRRNLREACGVGNDWNALDKQDLHLLYGKVLRFYPTSDEALVQLRDVSRKWRCKLPHSTVSKESNVSYIPPGDYKVSNTGEKYIIPSEVYNCVVYAVNGDYEHHGAVILTFISMDDTDIGFNAGAGSYKIRVGSESDNMRFKVRADEVAVKNEDGVRLRLKDDYVFIGTSNTNCIEFKGGALHIYTDELYVNENRVM